MQSIPSEKKKIKQMLLEGDINFQKCDLWITKTPIIPFAPVMYFGLSWLSQMK